MDFLTPDINRRVFIQGLGFISVGLLMGTLGGCEKLSEAIRNRPVRRRLRTGSALVDADIETYREAVELMKALPGSDPTSWTAQAAIHGLPGGFTFCEHGTDHFFDWHRAYLFYFEKICQKVTNNPQFGLPYWNWNQNPGIHSAFLDNTSALFLARTRTSMGSNSAVSTTTLDPMLDNTDFYTYRQQVEGTPHNTVHTYIGGTLGGFTSALDPLFWMHHCMVDYMWAKWNIELDHDNTNDPGWMSHDNAHFVDANGVATSTTAAITTLMPLISYRYESSAIGTHPATLEISRFREFQEVERRIRAGADIRFTIGSRARIAEKAAISIARPVQRETTLSTADYARIIAGDRSREKVFASIGFAQLPATSDYAVRVFVQLPTADRTTSIDDPHYAGSFAFFGTTPPAGTPPAGDHVHQPKFLVDLTPTLQRLLQRQELRDGQPISLQLVAVPFGDNFEKADTELLLENLDVITTPVRVRTGMR
jgi:tyrosinase